MIDVIIILGILFIIGGISKFLKWRKKRCRFPATQLYSDSAGVDESFYYRHLCHEHAVQNLEMLVNMKKVSLNICLRLNQISYEEYGKLFDELMEWKKQKWEEIYKND